MWRWILILGLVVGPLACESTSPEAPLVIVIDPGHPSETSQGATGPTGATEIETGWAVAQQLRPLLEADGHEVVFTKLVIDEVVTNRHRAEIGNHHNAAVIIRLHGDAVAARGTATFYPDRQGTRFGVTGPSQDVIDGSRAFVDVFHPAMIAALGPDWSDRGIRGDSQTSVGSQQGALTGSIFSEVPVVTIEMAVITDPDDEAFIASAAGQAKMAAAIAAGVRAVFGGPGTG